MSKSKKSKKLGRGKSPTRADHASLETNGIESLQAESGASLEHGDARTDGIPDGNEDGATCGMQDDAAALAVDPDAASHIDAAPATQADTCLDPSPAAEEEPLLEFVVYDRNDLLEKFIRPQRLMRQRAHEREDHESEPSAAQASSTPQVAIELHQPALAADPSAAPTTLEELVQRYLERLEQQGKSGGTLSSYKLELDVAMEHFGRQLPLADLEAALVQQYYECPRVTKTRSGRSKSPLSIAKTRRVMHQALMLGVAQGWVERRVIDGEGRAASSGA